MQACVGISGSSPERSVSLFPSWYEEGTLLTRSECSAFGLLGRRWWRLSVSAVPQFLWAQNNPDAEVAYFGVTYPGPLSLYIVCIVLMLHHN